MTLPAPADEARKIAHDVLNSVDLLDACDSRDPPEWHSSYCDAFTSALAAARTAGLEEAKQVAVAKQNKPFSGNCYSMAADIALVIDKLKSET